MILSQLVFTSCAVASTKLALQDFALSDGTILPKGTLVAAPLRAMHYDDENYADANTFQPWRFYRESDESDGEVNAQSMTTTTPTYLSFGHGKTAWYVQPIRTFRRHRS